MIFCQLGVYGRTKVIVVEPGLDDASPLAKLVDSLSREFEGHPSTSVQGDVQKEVVMTLQATR